MISIQRSPDLQYSHRLRLDTLIRLRWLAIVGQSLAVVTVAYWLQFPMAIGLCFTLIAAKIWATGGAAAGTACPSMTGGSGSGSSSPIRLVN